MKLRNIPILCALPRIADSLGNLFTADPEEVPVKTEQERIHEKMHQLQLKIMRETLQTQETELNALKAKNAEPAPEPGPIQEIIETQWTLKTEPVVQDNHATTTKELEEKLDVLVKDEAAIADTPQIPHQEPVERRDGLIPDGKSIDEKLEKVEGMRLKKTPGSSEKLEKKRKRKKSIRIKNRDNTVVTKQMYDYVMDAFPKFEKMKAENPEVVMTRDVFCRQVNRELGTDKTISVWSNMWMGHTKRENLPDEADVPKTEEE